MGVLIVNLIKSAFRDKYLRFWEWIFPPLLMTAFALFIRGELFATFILPGLAAFLLFQGLIYAIPYRLALLRENSLLRIAVEEGSIGMLSSAFVLSRVLISCIQAGLFIPIGIWILQPEIDIRAGWLIAAFAASLFGLGGFSLLVASLSKTVGSALGFAQLFYILLTAVSGIFFPLERSPEFLQLTSSLSPLTYTSEMLSYGLTGGGGKPPVEALLFLLLFGGAAAAVGLLILKRDLAAGRNWNRTVAGPASARG
ncbi:hypothetical protein DNH61_05820 [Paenibacillus sambharensis]|uniref:ABC-2 type transporter transmembrane domain-containing protein n=1 Tax=Paenibacillus sambharensis TaxID=1803190 RepID=A0A2W1LQC3_9BACL|nr:ABC transporter permease [Paenibacillus sambharensis]PZD96714.1 hypothetical protein DNH61_05820 [Paenibacillus sambharensis]